VGNLQGQLGRPLQPGRDVIETGEGELPRARVDLSQGVRLLSPDGRYRIEFHDLTQVEGRFFSPSGDPLHNNFDIPRQRLYFTGQVDDHFDFYSVFNRGYGALDVLDAYVNFKFDKEFNIRVGRTKTPYTYEYYKIAEGDLIAPERSVFVGNLAPNRQIGVMAFGRLFSEQVEYAAGVFNGPHRSFQDTNNFKNPFLYVNTKPFLYSGNDVLKNLNLGGSANYGREKDLLEPNGLRTANDETTTNTINNVSPTFLRFNSNATEVGETAFWAGDMAWYYRSMTALAMYNGGYITYNLPGKSGIRVPYSGWSAAVTYFVTGEEITTRKEVEPLRDFNWRDPLSHPGAVEVYGRAAYINAGSNVFSSGLVDPTLWSNDATVYDLGCNWYLNRYVRIFADWQYASYGSRVQVGPDRFTDSSNMFWLRTQIYY
jgi:phosphate-selective porin OprO/OprP